MTRRLQATFVLCAALLSACADNASSPLAPANLRGERATTDTPVTLNVGYFNPSPVLAMAQKHGFFADEHLTVKENKTPSSPVIFGKLRDGTWPIIFTQIDNVFNYRLNPSNPLGGTFEAVAFFGTDWGNGASLMARPEFTTVESLRGQTLEVDSPNSGFAFVLYGIMRAHGMERGVDYFVKVTGGTPARYADLLANKTAGTILNAGFQFKAEAVGMQHLGDIKDAIDPFMGGSGVATRSWLDENPDVAIRFIRAYDAGQSYVLDPANRDEVLAWLKTDAGGNAVVAQRTYDLLLTEGQGLIPNSDIDRKGMLGTATLRDSFGGFDSAQNLDWLTTPASGVYDLSFWRAARCQGKDRQSGACAA